MQLSLFGRKVEMEKPPAKPEPLADMTWDQWVVWRPTPFNCEYCGKLADNAGYGKTGPWRVHPACERIVAPYMMRIAMEDRRKEHLKNSLIGASK